MSVQMNWAYENLALVNESIHSALWYFECNENGEIVHLINQVSFRSAKIRIGRDAGFRYRPSTVSWRFC